MVHKPPQSLTAWPTSSAANFSKLPQDGRVKMILTPKVYYATHDTMPPSTQGGGFNISHGVVNPFYRERSPSSYRFQSFW